MEDKKKERIKVISILGIVIFLASAVVVTQSDICACWEEGRFSEKITLQIDEEQPIKGTNYSLLLTGAKSATCDAAAFEIYKNSKYENRTVLVTGADDAEDNRYEIGNIKIILKEVTNERIATFSIYFI